MTDDYLKEIIWWKIRDLLLENKIPQEQGEKFLKAIECIKAADRV